MLVVEDDESIRDVMVEALTAAGYRALSACDGAAALGLTQGESAGRIDAVVTDIVMPGGLTGFDVAYQLRDIHPQIRIIFMTGYHDDTIPTGSPGHAHRRSQSAWSKLCER